MSFPRFADCGRRPQRLDPCDFVPTDVAPVDDDLVQITAIEKQSNLVIVVKVGIGQQKIAIAFDEMDGDPALADQYLRDDALHGLAEFNADGLGVLTDNFDAVNRRKSLFLRCAAGPSGARPFLDDHRSREWRGRGLP